MVQATACRGRRHRRCDAPVQAARQAILKVRWKQVIVLAVTDAKWPLSTHCGHSLQAASCKMMSTFRDLEPCAVLIDDPAVLAVGWIDRHASFPTGETKDGVFKKLVELCKNPWQPAAAAGFHHCELCQYDRPPLKGEIYIPGCGCIYVAPAGIVHYIAAHWYQPPPVFAEAVLVCPPMQSMAYKRALLDNGGRSLVRIGKR